VVRAANRIQQRRPPDNSASARKREAQIGGCNIDRVFMDAGSRINLIYAKFLRAMHISLKFLKPTDCSFHGIFLGSANYPLGQILFNICFGNRLNYRQEKFEFEVMDWPSQYHAILGRPALVEKSLLVAHQFGICVAHMGCATNATPLITVYWWCISICATHSLNISGAYSICAISILCVAHIAICATN
jgi:hypothetical protein